MLNVQGLRAWYGQSEVLQGVSLRVQPGEMVALLGRNGAGRSTTAKALMGLLGREGRVTGLAQWHGQSLLSLATHEIARLGVGYVPETRDVFPTLTVQQNLDLGRRAPAADERGAGWTSEALYALFAPLQARQHTLAGLLSGGEQQMLALCRTLMGNPSLLIVDEPTEGLAPAIAAQVVHCLQLAQARGAAVLLTEQKLRLAFDVCQRVLVMGRGRVVFEGSPHQLQADDATRREWLQG